MELTSRFPQRCALALLLLCVPASAEELSFVPSGETKPEPYLIEKPTSIERGKRHPLIVYLHGRGQGHKFQWLSKEFTQFRKRAADRGYFVLIPHLGTDNWMNTRTRRVLNELLDKVLGSYPIDRARVHMMGMSMGGGGSLTYTIYNKSRVRSVCDIFGVTDLTQFYNAGSYHKSLSEALDGTPETAPEVYRAQSPMAHLDAFAKVPVLVLHGEDDRVVPVVHSRQFVKAMKTSGYQVEYKEVPGGRHLLSFIQGFEDEILDFFDATGEPVRFSEHLLANEHRYTFGLATVDIDGDGDLDLTYPDINTQRESTLYWLENNGRGDFQRHVIRQNQHGWLERHATGDINGDGRPDVAIADNLKGRLFWFANPDRPADSHWKRYVITTKCPNAYDVVLSDLDRDGDLDAAASGFSSGLITWYENPGQDGLDGEWTRRLIDEGMPEARTIATGDFNSDGKIDLLATAIGKRNLPADVQDHGSQVVWYENLGQTASGRWKKHTIDNRSRAPVHGHPTDLDGDGDLDVVMAHGMRTTVDPKVERHEVVWYENVGQPKSGRSWKRHEIGRLPFAFEAIARDLDSDGDMDVIATAWANTPRLTGQRPTKSGGDRVVWFENRGSVGDQWAIHNLQESFPQANQVIAADLNGDGRPDIVASCDGSWVNRKQVSKSEIRWWRNEGR